MNRRAVLGIIVAFLAGIAVATPMDLAIGRDRSHVVSTSEPWVGTWFSESDDDLYQFSADGSAIALRDNNVHLGHWSTVDEAHALYVFATQTGDYFSGPVGVDDSGNVVGPGGILHEVELVLP